MLKLRSRLIGQVRFFSSQQKKKFDESDDDMFFENIESAHVPKANTPLRRALRLIWRVLSYGSMGLVAYTYYQFKNSKDPKSETLVFPQVLEFVASAESTAVGFRSLFMDPPLDKLLPDLPKLPPGYMQPKTLVLDLKGTLLSSEYVFGKGYVIMKRPGLTEFLNKVSQMFEVVILCEEDTFLMSQLTESLDPQHRIFQARMGRECLSYRDGELTKDLKYLNRDLKSVVIIDKNPKMVKLHSDNAILLSEFHGAESDRALIELLPFLEHLVKDKIPDVRKEIEKYGHVDTGKKYLERLEKLRASLLKQQQSGLNRFLQKRPSSTTEDSEPLSTSTPKPPA
jgi:hypothetical protein